MQLLAKLISGESCSHLFKATLGECTTDRPSLSVHGTEFGSVKYECRQIRSIC